MERDPRQVLTEWLVLASQGGDEQAFTELHALCAGVRFAGAAELTAQLQWGALGFVFLLLMMFLKLWFWLEMHTNRVLRELKCVELLLVARSPASPARDVHD
ncbi:MAG: hypothetical protein IPL39_21805 [Opitutaceae bacterium]|nr:hypothetical protein [Opitutaceae bacterium]